MIEFSLIVLSYALIMLVIAIIGGVLRLRCLKRQEPRPVNFSSLVTSSVDKDIDNLHIENPGSIVLRSTLVNRGSWRVALDRVMSSQTFEEMKAEEYSKKL